MEDKILKFATAVVVVLTVAVCIGLPFFPQIHTWAVESREERLAEQEYAENQTEMKDLEIVAADTSEQVHGGQLQLKLPEGINGSDIQFTNDYVTQTIKISIPGTDRSYFENGPIPGSSNHIATLSYSSKGEDGVIEIVMDHVYELKTEYDSAYYYFDFLTPQEVYDKVVVIDAGHGGRAPGANKQGVNEKEIDLDIVLQLKKILDEDDHNIGVYYTRTDDSNPTKDVHDMCMAFFDGDTKKAMEIQLKAQPLIEALFSEVNPIPVKKALNLMGMEAGPLRSPLTEMTDANAAKLAEAMKNYGIKLA